MSTAEKAEYVVVELFVINDKYLVVKLWGELLALL